MSYDIFYSKQFIKLRRTGEVIPMILSGSSNCFEVRDDGRDGRRSRDWFSFSFFNRKGKLSEKPDLILKKVDAELARRIRERHDKSVKPADVRKHFGYYTAIVVGSGQCGDTSFDDWRGVFENGIRRALTIEELDKLGVHPYFTAYTPNGSEGKPAEVSITTERQYFDELKKWREWAIGKQTNFSLSFFPHDTEEVLEKLRAGKRKAPRQKTNVEQPFFFRLRNDNGVLIRYTSRGYRYSYGEYGAGKRFKTESEAEKYRKGLVEKHRHQAETWKVEQVNRPATFAI